MLSGICINSQDPSAGSAPADDVREPVDWQELPARKLRKISLVLSRVCFNSVMTLSKMYFLIHFHSLCAFLKTGSIDSISNSICQRICITMVISFRRKCDRRCQRATVAVFLCVLWNDAALILMLGTIAGQGINLLLLLRPTGRLSKRLDEENLMQWCAMTTEVRVDDFVRLCFM